MNQYQPEMTQAGLLPSHEVQAMDEYGALQAGHIAGERPLSLYVDKREIVTLMTLGSHPELLALGYLRNQGFVSDLRDIRAVQVDWDVEAAVVSTRTGVSDWDARLNRRTVTSGCGQGTVFGSLLDRLGKARLPSPKLSQSGLYALLDQLRGYNQVYRQAGAVHGCALCGAAGVELFVEDVGRHNAVDAIAGHMWLHDTRGHDKTFYTTGRLTSEMVIKVVQMGIPVLISRSGITRMGLDLARRFGVIMIARAKGRHFLVYHGSERVVLDAPPPRPPRARSKDRGT